MTDRPILFSAPMVRALLADRKTQTRRIVKGAIGLTLPIVLNEETGEWGWWWTEWRWEGEGLNARQIPYDERFHALRCPYGALGDHLIVRETFRLPAEYDDWKPSLVRPDAPVWYEADGRAPEGWGKTRVSIHMPRWASRITLQITGLRVELLNDCSDQDAIAEGVVDTGRRDGEPWAHCHVPGTPGGYEADPLAVYARLWEQINGDGSWVVNPWVWAVSFERIQP